MGGMDGGHKWGTWMGGMDESMDGGHGAETCVGCGMLQTQPGSGH